MDIEAFVIRPITHDDLDWLFDLKNKVDLGLTSLPNNQNYLTKRLATVVQSFAEAIPPEQRIYLFLREELASGERIGIAGIQACAGHDSIFYNFQISNVTQISRSLNKSFDHKVLSLVDNFQDTTELISFWMDPEYRGKKMGKALSMARLLFIAQFPNLFSNEIIAEIRGECDENGTNPFWETVGRKFFGIDFVDADYLTLTSDKQFIADLMPRLPIYVDLLPLAAQQVIAKAHKAAEPAKMFLESQGFKFQNHIDIFDAGPTISAAVENIKIVASSKVAKVVDIIENTVSGIEVLISNTNLSMRTTVSKITETGVGDIIINKNLASILQIDIGSSVRYASI